MITALKHSRDPIWFLDKKMNLTDFNSSFSALAHKFYGKHIEGFVNCAGIFEKDILNKWICFYDAALAGECFNKEVTLISNTDEHYYDVVFNPVWENGEVEGVAVFAKDITAYKNIELNLNSKVKELNAFMYKATHDLRSPLVSLLGLVTLANKEAGSNQRLNQYFSMIVKSVNKMDQMLLDLVSLTNATHAQLELSNVDFAVLTEEVLDSLKYSKNFDRIRIDRHFGGIKEFYTDRRIIYSVLQNLIDNSVKYSHTDKSIAPLITIDIQYSDNNCFITIADNGIGIPAGCVTKVFDMFYRAVSGYNGTGLGLYIVKTSVEKLKGTISLESEKNKFTSIKIVLPNLK
ncbi:MAG: hypothetical protein K0Q95_391 [Bacteroidota bacterium]|jgi:signal transduction histidine kinase|nr:hypothetical protein [Bacteroidota bacterium]